MRRALPFVIGGIVVLLIGIGIGINQGNKRTPKTKSVADSVEPKSGTISGTFVLIDADTEYGTSIDTAGRACSGDGGYGDIHEAAVVTVKDEAGKVIGTTSLGPGDVMSYATNRRDATRCRFSFSIPDLPKASFYSIEVAHRGELTYSRDELDGRDWTVELTLGD